MLTTTPTPELKVVLFDFGGVLLRQHDNPVNVSAALSAGMRARLCPGVDALESVLRSERVPC